MRTLRKVLLLLVFLFVAGVAAVAAEPVSVRSSLPFLWVRAAPSSYAQAVYTVYPTGYATLETTGNTHWDGTQTWAEVYLIGNAGIRGWVEQGAIVGSTPSAPPADGPVVVPAPPVYAPQAGAWQMFPVPWNQNVVIRFPLQVPYYSGTVSDSEWAAG